MTVALGRIVPLAARGHTNVDIGELVGRRYNQVPVCRRRYALIGLARLADGPRAGEPPPVYGHDDVLLLGTTVTEPLPDEATRWPMQALARRLK